MKFALHGGKRVEAEANLKGAVCQVCKAEVIAKCGDIKIHHWAHKSKRKCDHWWENETQWHRDWKNINKRNVNYLPIQNLENILPRTSSFVTSPVSSPRY